VFVEGNNYYSREWEVGDRWNFSKTTK
jgi:hypothetical protein